MAFVELQGLSKAFAGQVVLEEVSLSAAEGETLVLLGRSGSGKTTLLRLVAGFEAPDAGRVVVGGDDVTALPPARRRFGMGFQHYALFPHLSVAENVAFGLDRVESTERDARVTEMLDLVELEGYGARRIDQLSGGQQQRVALARALAPRPRVMLLDEPLSNLDPALRERTRRLLRRAVRAVGITALWVTHEQAEAFDVGDRIALLEGGRLAQVGAPAELYREPVDRHTAAFVGRAGWLPVDIDADGRARFAGRTLPWAIAGTAPEGPAELLLRPEMLALVPPEAASLRGTVTSGRFTGATTVFSAELEGQRREEEAVAVALEVDAPYAAAEIGDLVGLELVDGAAPVRVYPIGEPGDPS